MKQTKINKGTFYLGDCMDLMKDTPDNFYELAIVDPPYGIGLSDSKTGTVIKNKSDKELFKKKNWDNAIPDKIYFDELFRVSKNQIIWGGNYFLDILGYCKAPIIWDKLNGKSLYADGEMAWTSSDNGLPRNLKIWRHQWCGCFRDSERDMNKNGFKIHPTQKPVALYKWLLKNYAKDGDKILDTHGGSMSIAIAVHKMNTEENMNLTLDLVEIDEEYYEQGIKRVQEQTKQNSLFDNNTSNCYN